MLVRNRLKACASVWQPCGLGPAAPQMSWISRPQGRTPELEPRASSAASSASSGGIEQSGGPGGSGLHDRSCPPDLRALYGAGLRLMEGLKLRVKDLDFGRNEIVVRDGKGQQDRVTILPEAVKESLKEDLQRVKTLHERDLSQGAGRVAMPDAIARKYPNANREWA